MEGTVPPVRPLTKAQSMTLQKEFEEFVARAPQMTLERLLRQKLKEAGVRSWRGGAAALAAHLVGDRDSEFHWEDPFDEDNRHIDLTFTEEDGQKIERLADALSEDNLTDLATNLMAEASEMIRKRYTAEWFRYRRHVERDLGSFRNNLEMRWGKALDGLRILLDLCLDEGEKERRRLTRRSKRGTTAKRLAILRLHARACQIAAEIICLLENGFSNGAMARWRTLYEIDVIASVLSDGKNDLAERYLDHEVVEQKRALDLYQRNGDSEKEAMPSRREAQAISREFQRLVRAYGKSFGTPYGWASEHLKNSAPRFVDLEAAATGARLRIRYKLASYNVHASPSFFSHNLANLLGDGTVFAGASNAGLAPPGHLTTQTLLRVTYLLMERSRSMDNLALLNALIAIREETIEEFWNSDTILRREDAEIRRVGREHGFEVDTSTI